MEAVSGRAWTARMMARYQRQMVLPQVGTHGQERLLASRVLIVGAGALGSAAATYLALAGVGILGLADGDVVELSNLHRQILHDETQVGRAKTQSGAERLRQLNPDVTVIEHQAFLTSDNMMGLASNYDLIVNGSDNFPTRYLVNDAAVLTGIPMVDAAILRFEGQLAIYRPGRGCYRCLFPVPPPRGLVPDCAEAGILGAVAGVLGSMQAVEALKILLGLNDDQEGGLLLYDALSSSWRRMVFHRDPNCAVCGDHPTVTAPIDYEVFCGSETADRAPEGPMPYAVRVEDAADFMRNRRPLVIDIRNVEEFRAGHIPDARHCPMENLDHLVNEQIGDQPILVVCASGLRSRYAAEYLRLRGFVASTLAGGTVAWQEAGLPIAQEDR
ncbi:molybdopterin-synthase adenylyltransferase MoeB [Sulfobacillus harzensis]|uniref:Molybdopterin-synthase adenylyltransferase MoeB n=1 Tax=Sulfobacillus harzensis TaxID=2729629 RepID=A0A7Y0Q2N2_9FIRM|nr:molybdopterin-synthase adenylyltransferase MoeB [Sulfobacillus harzensis]NMP23358.1 molybdopterin-synthase adenylyltransferase MoeB [Sulfobacillus harzensis]